jgi:2-oxoglutarate dehydrogenase complex dehydrogenase (E1) component-like enzyme
MPVMSQEWLDQNQANKQRWFLGHAEAIDFINCFFSAVELWDDLIEAKEKTGTDDVAVIRLEQLYPFPGKQVKAILSKYTNHIIYVLLDATHEIWLNDNYKNTIIQTLRLFI